MYVSAVTTSSERAFHRRVTHRSRRRRSIVQLSVGRPTLRMDFACDAINYMLNSWPNIHSCPPYETRTFYHLLEWLRNENGVQNTDLDPISLYANECAMTNKCDYLQKRGFSRVTYVNSLVGPN